MTFAKYLGGAINGVYSVIEGNKAALKSSRDGHLPYPSSYRIELYGTNELDEEFTNRLHQLIGVIP